MYQEAGTNYPRPTLNIVHDVRDKMNFKIRAHEIPHKVRNTVRSALKWGERHVHAMHQTGASRPAKNQGKQEHGFCINSISNSPSICTYKKLYALKYIQCMIHLTDNCMMPSCPRRLQGREHRKERRRKPDHFLCLNLEIQWCFLISGFIPSSLSSFCDFKVLPMCLVAWRSELFCYIIYHESSVLYSMALELYIKPPSVFIVSSSFVARSSLILGLK